MTESTPATTPALPALQVEIWSDVACPWCFIGKQRFAAGLASFEHRDRVQVTWRSYQLSPDAVSGPPGSELELLARAKGLDLDQVREMFAHVTALAAGEGLAVDFETVRPANTFDAHRLVHLAAAQLPGVAGDVVQELMSAHFERGIAVDDGAELVAIAGRLGLDTDRIRAALAPVDGSDEGDAAADAVRADVAQARAIGVTGVPFFVLDRRLGVSGAQSAELFAAALAQAWDGFADA
ncbi:DsbA family oxidoreductase [Pengzhenrongella sicca]|uniref:DsbA family oxidoreductase n=1 Tax=Pengzhenrongella sicca TaxID=2819238 RepID=A0A8A4ZI96_9MICO|nr:DsbA family oxidoreductase [Pengzhenrongella sicca]QTE30699.1 DsbA family oxidoreductase [Pengzhenrongella sicca]